MALGNSALKQAVLSLTMLVRAKRAILKAFTFTMSIHNTLSKPRSIKVFPIGQSYTKMAMI